MSVKVMSAVFERYPNGGGEMVLALALADHACDDGTKVFPSVAALAAKTRQSARTVQYQLRRMETAGWLIRVSHGNGGRSMSTEYRISLAWIQGADFGALGKGANENGAEIAPLQKGANQSTKGCKPEHKRVQPVAPANNHHRTINNHQGERAQAHATPDRPVDVTEQTWRDWLALRKQKRAAVTETVLNAARREAGKAGMTLEAFLQTWCMRGSQGLAADWLKPSERGGQQPQGKYAAAAATIYEGL